MPGCRRLVATLAVLCAVLAAPAAAQDIVAARYATPTDRYAHGVLGDTEEWGALVLSLSDGAERRLTLPETRVFEDTTPRLADVDNDGDIEAVVVETSMREGARLSVYDETGLLAATPYIGRAFRWLAPVGVADLDSDGTVEIAYVDRPHLAKRLRIWRFADGDLHPVADRAGMTNHRIGWDYIPGGIRHCGGIAEIIVADGAWSRILAATLRGDDIRTRDLGPYTGPESLQAALTCL